MGDTIGLVSLAIDPTPILERTAGGVRDVLVTTLLAVGSIQLLALPLLVSAARRLRRQRDELSASAQEQEYLATHDPLTSLANRTRFEHLLAEEIRAHETGLIGVTDCLRVGAPLNLTVIVVVTTMTILT